MFVYADNAATTSVSKAALDAMLPYLTDYYGNPSSLYAFGQKATEALQASRETVAKYLNADPKEIYFTSGGSEADNQAIVSAARLGARKGKKHLISTQFEHHAVLHTLAKLEKEGFEVTLLDPHSDGVIRIEDVKNALRDDTCLVTIMFANNEIGTVQPIEEIGALCRERKVLFHTDAVQAAGHMPIDVKAMNIDMLSMSGHKFHAPKGVGVLYAKKGTVLTNIIEGGAQERGKRAGTENVAGIVAMAAALKESCDHMEENTAKIIPMRDKLFAELSKIPHSKINGSLEHHVPGTVNMCFEGIEGESLLLMLDDQGICASSGSACTSGSLDPSHVLLSLGIPHEIAHGSLRLSIGEYNTMEEIDHIIEVVPKVVEYLRSISPVWDELEKGELKHLI
ncbi:MAG: cysteine desulfurase NifS [Oscillospiraceae bacterium]|jgi:cysteine desulfurase|nr:cysteine desulfurase NifS [Oscillospiraceae bacterium]MBR4550805.1 cysteine desulfurase NifS [Oscillospiraceae bacterium]